MMADVIEGDVIKVTSGPRTGKNFHVRKLMDERSQTAGVTGSRWLDSVCTVHRGSDNETVNDFGQSVAGYSAVETDEPVSFQTKRIGGVSEEGWGQKVVEVDVAYFDTVTVEIELTEEAQIEAL